MTRKFSRVFAAMALSVAALLSVSGSAFAADNTNLAGRPIDGSADSSCQGTVYGRVDGVMVLWTANHCNEGVGNPVYNADGNVIGLWMSKTIGAPWDLAAISLYPGFYPPDNRNLIYKGNGTWWSNGYKMPVTGLSCNNLEDTFTYHSNLTVYQSWQPYLTASNSYRTGKMPGYYTHPDSTHCEVMTTIPNVAAPGKASGSPFFVATYGASVAGVATRLGPDGLNFTPWYSGIRAYDAWNKSNGGSGAFFCSNSACN